MLFTTPTFALLYLPLVLAVFVLLGRLAPVWAASWLFLASLVSQLKLDAQRLASQALVRTPPQHGQTLPAPGTITGAPADTRLVTAVVDRFLERSGPFLKTGRLIILVDGCRLRKTTASGAAQEERKLFIRLASAAGVRVIDLEPLYAAHAAQSARSLDVGPYDRHLNRLGVAVAMQAAAEALR